MQPPRITDLRDSVRPGAERAVSEQVASHYSPPARDALDLVASWLVDPRTESRSPSSTDGPRIDLDGHVASFLGARSGRLGA